MVSATKQTMYLSPFLLTCIYTPGNWRSCAKMWHRFFWPKDTDWSYSNSASELVVWVYLCPYKTGPSLGETDPIVMLTWNQTTLFQEVLWERKWKQYCLLLSLRQVTLQTVRYIFCFCPLIITLLTSVRFCQLMSAEMWPSACLQFIKTTHHSGSCRLCVLWGNLIFTVHTSTCPLSRHTLFKLLVVFSSRKC